MLAFYPCSKHYQDYANVADQLSIQVSVYIGPANGPLFLGDASIKDMALQISQAEGPSGANSEYIFNLADFYRKYLPHVVDNHLYDIEKELLLLLQR